MAVNLKHIAAVPTAKDFIDIVLSRTQRQTPTVVHRGVRTPRPPAACTARHAATDTRHTPHRPPVCHFPHPVLLHAQGASTRHPSRHRCRRHTPRVLCPFYARLLLQAVSAAVHARMSLTLPLLPCALHR